MKHHQYISKTLKKVEKTLMSRRSSMAFGVPNMTIAVGIRFREYCYASRADDIEGWIIGRCISAGRG